MEAALKDFHDWLASLPVSDLDMQYYATFDESGTVTGILSEFSSKDMPNRIAVDKEIAESVIQGKTTLNSYVVDLTSATVEFIEIHALQKIDDVLHRVVGKNWSSEIDNDVFLTYNRKQQQLTIELSSKYNGTKVVENMRPKKVHWAGSTELSFLITHYNDPSYLDQLVVVKIDELIQNKKVIDTINLPNNFSVYTRRLFKNYVVEEI
jgi:hypothetical protein